jgi:hypothetical protein
MGNDQRLNSRTILDQVFWAGVTPPSQADAPPPAKEAPREPSAVLLERAGFPPEEPERVLAPNNSLQPEAIAGADAAPIDISATTDRGEPKTDVSEPEPAPAQEISTVDSPSVQPILMDAAEPHLAFRNMLHRAAPSEEAPPADFGAATDRDAPKAEASGPELAEEIPSLNSPSVQPILMDVEVAHPAFRNMLRGAAPGEEAPPADFGAATDRDAPKAEASGPEPAEEIPSLSSPPVQPILIEDVNFADHPLQMEPQEAALADAWMRCVTTPTRSRITASA